MFNVFFPDGKSVPCDAPTSGEELLRRLGGSQSGVPVVAWHVNHYLRPLNWIVDKNARISWVDLASAEGVSVFQSSLSFVLTIAARRVLGRGLRVTHSISEGTFWELMPRPGERLNGEDEEIPADKVSAIAAEMERIIAADLPIRAEMTPIDEARRFFEEHERPDKAKLLAHMWSDLPVEMACCDGERDHFYSPMVPSTGYLRPYKLSKLTPGVVLRFPVALSRGGLPEYRPSHKLSTVFLDYADWMRKLHVVNLVEICEAVARDGGKELILMSEALHAQKVAEVTQDFLSVPERRVITIAGPSGSGKTTTSHKLRIQLEVAGRRPVAISLDDYFVDRDKCPLDEDGKRDFEAVEAVDTELLNEHIHALLTGKTVRLPRFDFYEGRRMAGAELKLEKDDVLILEGLHGLNDKVLAAIPPQARYGVFLSPLTSLCLDQHSRTSTTDLRLLRRLIRDNRTRGNSPEATLNRWPSVVRGAARYIFPYQKNADVMFNSSLIYELPVMKPYAENLLRSVGEESPQRGEAMRLLRMLRFVPAMDPRLVPSNSLLREFIGGSIIEI
ncbi:nucleoside kinase [Pyramidobacter sp. YE332]|uniref:nucleoside kinase n=1 Tax=unclassified Pyramidobacter TaxID=2632171 RepID=UPI00098F8641|nr:MULTISPECIES: nucleoside kinase [unclassified Pyramidobacter]OON89941.1 AAA family ATPase [Pyramidobacter sp. C12-8]WOL39142.1 nucleoside kinase [Pyramidobacter sp. YE332]